MNWRELPQVEYFRLSDRNSQQTLMAAMQDREAGLMRTTHNGTDMNVLYRPFSAEQGYLLFLVPSETLSIPAMRAAEYALARTRRHIDDLVPLAGLIILSVALFALYGSKAITAPLKRLVDAVDDVARGDFSTRVAVKTGDELEELADAFNRMVPQLEEHTRVREALTLASEVQRRLLPQGNPGWRGIDIAGFSIYSEQTGGDYYDYLTVGPASKREIAVTLGDVSGHGVSSALLMATVRALLHSASGQDLAPNEVLQHINEKIVDDVHAGQFMTLFYLRVDVKKGRLRWSSAGHDPAIRFNRLSNQFSELHGHDIPLGVDAGWRFAQHDRTDISSEDIIVIGSDGIWDTRNPRGEFFGKARLRDVIRANQAETAQGICDAVIAALQGFRGGAAQRDDVTAVVFRLTGPRTP